MILRLSFIDSPVSARCGVLGAMLTTLGLLAGCQSRPITLDGGMTPEERRAFSILLVLCDQRMVGDLAEIQHISGESLILQIDSEGQVVDIHIGYFGDMRHESEIARIRELRGAKVALGVQRARKRDSGIWAVMPFDLHLGIRQFDEVADLLAHVEALDGESDWFAQALRGEKGHWDSYLHERRYETEDHQQLNDLLSTVDAAELRRDLIGWLCRNLGQPDVPWVFPRVSLKWYGVEVANVRQLTVTVLEKLNGLGANTLRSGSWGYFDVSRRLWILDKLLSSEGLL